MPKIARELGALAVARLRDAGLHPVGGVAGLCLQVAPGGARSWILRVSVAGKRRDIGLGAYPETSVAAARDKAREARELIRQGVDPVEQRRAAVSALKAERASAKTFKQTAEEYIKAHEAGWRNTKHAGQWRNTLATYVYPTIGDLLVKDIEKEHVLEVLASIWTTKNETASRVRGRIESVLSFAMQAGYRPEGLNPARWRGGLDKLLAAPSKVQRAEHFAALPVAEIGVFVKKLRQVEGMGARALEFAILTAARSGEVRGAVWAEIDLEAKVWSVPASRMKAGVPHRVPLSDAALTLLKAVPRVAGSDLVFPNRSGNKLSDMTLTQVMRRMGVDAVPHGCRSTFRNWAAEIASIPREIAEAALAHVVANKVEAAYLRSDVFERRRRVMQDWADFVARPARPAQVLELDRRRRRR